MKNRNGVKAVTAFDIMNRLRKAGDEIASIQESIDMRREAVTAITAKYGTEGGHASGVNDKMGEYAARVDELIDRLRRRKRRWAAEMEVCLNLAEKMEGVERTVLYSYYAKAWTLDAIAESAGYSPAYTRKVKAQLDAKLKQEPCAMPEWYEDEI